MTDFPSCLAVLSGENSYGNVTNFQEGAGQIYIVDAAECWADVEADIENQLAYAEIGIAALEALHYPVETIREQMEGIEGVRDYSGGLMTFTSFQWDESTLESGDQLGLCVYQSSGKSSENATSCWSVDYAGNGEYTSESSYLLKASTIGSNSQLEDFEPVDASLPSGTKGHWLITEPVVAFETTKKVFAARFSPKSNSTSDPSIKVGTTEVVTYQASRTSAPTNASETSNLSSVDHMMLKQTNSFSTNYRWFSESVELLCYSDANCSYVPPAPKPTGASAVTTVGTLLAACAAMLAF
jgi:hypothetical protein